MQLAPLFNDARMKEAAIQGPARRGAFEHSGRIDAHFPIFPCFAIVQNAVAHVMKEVRAVAAAKVSKSGRVQKGSERVRRAHLACAHPPFAKRLDGVDEQAVECENRKPWPIRQLLLLIEARKVAHRAQEALADSATNGVKNFAPRGWVVLRKQISELLVTSDGEVRCKLGGQVHAMPSSAGRMPAGTPSTPEACRLTGRA